MCVDSECSVTAVSINHFDMYTLFYIPFHCYKILGFSDDGTDLGLYS